MILLPTKLNMNIVEAVTMLNYVKNTIGIAPPSAKLYVLGIKADNLRRIKGVEKIQYHLITLIKH